MFFILNVIDKRRDAIVGLGILFSFNSSMRRFAIPVELPMWLLPIIAIVPLTVISFFVDLPIGNSAHMGGLVIGLVYAFYLRKKFPNKLNRIRRFFK